MLRFPKCVLQSRSKILIIVLSILISISSSFHCSSNPCMYGICLEDGNSSYSCYCIDGYTGLNCEINWNDCWSNPCLNGGTCNDAVAAYNCSCTEGFLGVNCEQKYNECLNQPCLNNGTCVDYNGITCQCPEGYSGEYCEIDISVCNDTICKNSGECVEGPGLSFSCRCTEGWTGQFCEEDIDECLASPCLNGGLCINLPASYTCACLFGFTGKDCDKEIVPCEHNPCQNDAVCLFEDNQSVCYCVPDYHGMLCELKYDDCESKFAKCENGGTCIDGINNFTCSCPAQFAGEMCNENIGFTSSSVTTEVSTESIQMKSSLTSTENIFIQSSPSFIFTTDYSESREIPLEGTIYPSTNLTTIDNSINTTTTFSNLITTVKSLNSTTGILNTTAHSLHSSSTIAVVTNGAVLGDTDLTTVSINENQTEQIFPQTTTLFGNLSTKVYTTDIYESRMFNESSTIYMEETTLPYEIPSVSPQISFSQKPVPTSPSFESTTSSNIFSFITDEWSLTETSVGVAEETTENFEDKISTKIPISTLETTSRTMILKPVSDTLFTDSTISLTSDFPSTPITGVSTEDSFYKTSFPTQFDFESTSVRTTDRDIIYKCNFQQCANTTLCLRNFTECDCSYRDNCKTTPSITNAAFNGKSYIRQEALIGENGTLQISLRLKTISKSGILVHAFFDDERYVLLYIEMGLLKFQFSCGLQTMLFGEIDSPINNGFEVDIEMRFQYVIEPKTDKCSARLLINDTIAMSGKQVLPSHETMPQSSRLHLGGIPLAFSHHFPQIALGFVGCMSLLKINDIQRNFITDSMEVFQIDECSSFLCLANPCRNSGACEEIDGKIQCKCPLGYTGNLCERSACDDNPCHLGATCITYPGTSFICVCPLGMHGLLCEEDITIFQPSFTVFTPGLSSYMAYGISPSIKDGMELKMRIIPHTVEQISLIAYLGQSGSRRDLTDHFSITYVRGYIMLTWDLGSGVRRIFTNTPLSLKAYRAHTLRAGRKGREAWLSIDGIGNVTGGAVGSMARLDVSPILYVGGHKSKNFETLPHDLPLHAGFSGCIYDIELRTEDNVFPITQSNPATGRGIGECHRNECSHNSCKNGAVCLNHGPTYSCICMKDWEGPDCSKSSVTCNSSTCQKIDK